MRVDVFFSVAEADPALMQDAGVVVIDAVRATTCMVEALAGGARAIYPAASTEEAVRLATSMGRDDTLLCGERQGVMVEGFDLGNSPADFLAERVAGKRLVMSTTNGTRAFGTVAGADPVVVCAFTNLGAVARHVAGLDHVVVLCSGRQDRFCLEDALCAGHLIRRMAPPGTPEPEMNDAAQAAWVLAGEVTSARSVLERTAAGQALAEIGLQDDLDICAQVDRHDVVPVMKDGALTLTP